MRIVHRSDLISLPTFGNRDPLVTWDELIAALQAFDGIDRDNDGVGDPPFCVLNPSSYDATGREQMSMMRGPLHHLFEYIASSILQVDGPHQVRHLDTVGMRLLANTSAMAEAVRIYASLLDLMSPVQGLEIWNGPLNHAAVDYKRHYREGACVCAFTAKGQDVLKGQEVPTSPSTAVGSALVAPHGVGSLEACNSVDDCPRALPGTGNGALVNPTPMLIVAVSKVQVLRHSLMKHEAWQLISYLHEEDVSRTCAHVSE